MTSKTKTVTKKIVPPPITPQQRLATAMMKGGSATEGEWVDVESSNIKRIMWERVMWVEFHNGSRYKYVGVSADAWQEMMAATSHGAYLATHVMKKYPTTKG